MAGTAAGDLRDSLADTARAMVESGAETGLQIAVLHRGQLVADVAVGVADPATGRPVTPGTLFFASSAAKGIAATVAHVLAERGMVEYDLRLAEVWPEFAAHGKDRVTLRHVLRHTAGVPGLPPCCASSTRRCSGTSAPRWSHGNGSPRWPRSRSPAWTR
jgi:CubicO group peptidase (beta-lactamase class C family)